MSSTQITIIGDTPSELGQRALEMANALGAVPAPSALLHEMPVSEITDHLRKLLPDMDIRIIAKGSNDVQGTDEEQGPKETPTPPSKTKKKRSRKKATPSADSTAGDPPTKTPPAQEQPHADIEGMSHDQLISTARNEWLLVFNSGKEGREKMNTVLKQYEVSRLRDIGVDDLPTVIIMARRALAGR